MRRRGLWWVAAATALLVLGGCGSDSTANVGADSGAQRISDSDSPRDYFSRRPRCKPGVALYSEVADLGGDSPGGPTEPEEALAAHLAQYYSGRLNVQSFTRAADSSKAADPEQRRARQDARHRVHRRRTPGRRLLLRDVRLETHPDARHRTRAFDDRRLRRRVDQTQYRQESAGAA